VDGGNASGPCISNAGQGWINIEDSFASGHDTIPSHPRCRCDVEYRTAGLQQRSTHTLPLLELPTEVEPVTVRTVERDADGAILGIMEQDANGRATTKLVERDSAGRIWRVTEHHG
jgi:hypothetical protein